MTSLICRTSMSIRKPLWRISICGAVLATGCSPGELGENRGEGNAGASSGSGGNSGGSGGISAGSGGGGSGGSGGSVANGATGGVGADGAAITVSPQSLDTYEVGDAAEFTVVLSIQPVASVTLSIESDTPSEGKASPGSLEFTADNWDEPQTVTVTGQPQFGLDVGVAYNVVVGAAVSDDARYHTFDPPDVSAFNHDFHVERITHSTTEGSVSGYVGQPSISADGRLIAFESDADNLVTFDQNEKRDIFVYDRDLRKTTRIVNDELGGADGSSYNPRISADGKFVCFESEAANWSLTDNDILKKRDIFVHDLAGRKTERVSRSMFGGLGGIQDSFHCSISGEGRYVAFDTLSNDLVDGDDNELKDVFVYDRVAKTTTLASRATGVEGRLTNADAVSAEISKDGSLVVFRSSSNHLTIDANPGIMHLYSRDLVEAETRMASVNTGAQPADAWVAWPRLGGDGRFVAFHSAATNLSVEASDDNVVTDVFLRDLVDGTTQLVSVDDSGAGVLGKSRAPCVSDDGRYVGFYSHSSILVPGDTNDAADVFVRDTKGAGGTRRMSVASDGSQASGESKPNADYPETELACDLSDDGEFIVFRTDAQLVREDDDTQRDLYVVRVPDAWRAQ
jgi:Tol biopolymer transport system component